MRRPAASPAYLMEPMAEFAATTREGEPSSWVHPSTGIRETGSFFGVRADRLFGCVYEPATRPAAGMVVCCPLQAELLRNYRREVLLARALAVEGIAVQRFHYRGSGHSEGETEAMTFDAMLEDALDAGEQLAARTGVESVGFAGARFGGLVAAAAAAATGAPLVLWEPVVRPDRYFDEILRFRLVREITGAGPAQTADDLLAEMGRTGSVDILGHTLERALYESARARALDSIVTTAIPSILLLQMAPGRSMRRPYETLAATWRTEGIDVTTEVIVDREAWWLSGDMWPVHETHPPTIKLLETTVGWARAQPVFAGSTP